MRYILGVQLIHNYESFLLQFSYSEPCWPENTTLQGFMFTILLLYTHIEN